jgi:hypothetical protein
MAVAAERIKQQTDPFDWEFAETQLTQNQLADHASPITTHERLPESEIYGRSLSTIHRLGAFAIGKSHAEIIDSPEAEQARAEFYTSVEEGFGTDAELGDVLEVRDFDDRPVISGRVMAKDLKTPVSGMTEAGLACAIEKARVETANDDYRFLPQLTRSRWDHDNALIVDKMVRGETDYNTRIVISPFPEEAAAESGDDYWRNIGYVPHLRRGFVQLYYAGEEKCISGSLSFNGSNKNRLRELSGKCGVDIPEAERTDDWLQYAITDTLSETEAKELAIEIANQAGDPKYKNNGSKHKKTTNTAEITSEHRAIMDTVFNESYVHMCESLARGYQTPATKELVAQFADKAQHFNRRYRDALYKMQSNSEHFTDDDSIVLHELLVYSTIEMMRALHLQATKPGANSNSLFNTDYLDVAHIQSLDSASFQSMLGGFGGEGAQHNRTYSACGLAISLGEMDNLTESPQRAFGDAESSGKKLMNCPFCPAKVYDDPCAKILCCPECKAKVVNGRVVDKGDGGRQTRAKQAAEKRRREVELAKQVDEVYEAKGLTAREFSSQKKSPAVAAYN